MKLIKEIILYREMIFSLIRRDLRGRYKGSVLGFLWTFVNPLLQLAIYTVVFSVFLRTNIDKYYMFLFVALIPWFFFSAALTGGASCILGSKDMVKKIYFPREVVPISYVTSSFVNMLLSFLVIFIVLFFSRLPVKPLLLLYLVPIMLVEYILCLGITFLSSSVTVYFRDLEHILGIISMGWMYLTPIMYPPDMVPEEFQAIYRMNPMYPIIVAYRDVLYYSRPPEMSSLLSGFLLGGIILLIGVLVFNKLKRHFVEEL